MEALFKQLVNDTADYCQFHGLLESMSDDEKGNLQERLIKVYFEAYALHYHIDKYYARVTNDKIPEYFMANEKDWGTDGYILHKDGTMSLVQVKYRSDSQASMFREYISNMSTEAGSLIRQGRFKHLYLICDTDKPPKNLSNSEINSWGIKFILSHHLWEMDWEAIQNVVNVEVEEKPIRPLDPLHRWQSEGLSEVTKNGSNFGRAQVIAPCGAGKSRFALEMIKNYYRVLILVPTLQLLSQMFDFLRKHQPGRSIILVGSDVNTENDEGEIIQYDLTTDQDDIGCLIEEGRDPIVISTYNSLRQIDESLQFNLTICDEAHRCCTSKTSFYTRPTDEDFQSDNILYMTATPKIYYGDGTDKYVRSMDNTEVFGERYSYSFRQAIADGIISDYQVITSRAVIPIVDVNLDDTHFNAMFLVKGLQETNVHSLMVFCNSHKESRELCEAVKDELSIRDVQGYKVILMKNRCSSNEKARAIRMVQSGIKVIIFNVRVFTLGSDLPKLQGVMLCGSRQSKIDIVQSVSRCLRKCEGKEKGFIFIPCLIRGDDYFDDGNYKNLRNFIISIGSIDKEIVEEVFLRGKDNGCGERRIRFLDMKNEISEFAKMRLSYDDFVIKVCDSIGTRSGGDYVVLRWFERSNELEEFIKTTGKVPKQSKTTSNLEQHLSQWMFCQNRLYKDKNGVMLNHDVKARWENILKNYPEVLGDVGRWYIKLGLFEEFYKRTGRVPRQSGTDLSKEEQSLGIWIRNQKTNEGIGIMLFPDVKAKWEEILELYPVLQQNLVSIWLRKLEEYKNFVTEHGRAPGKLPYVIEGEEGLYSWKHTQHYNYKRARGAMTNPEVKKIWEETLECSPELHNVNIVKNWFKRLGELEDFFLKHGRVPRCSSDNTDIEEKKLGCWRVEQNSNYFNNEGIMSDLEIRKKWEEFLEQRPDFRRPDRVAICLKRLLEIEKFKEINGRVPRSCGTNLDDDEKTLGTLITGYRSLYKQGKGIMSDPVARREWEEFLIRCPEANRIDNVSMWLETLGEIIEFYKQNDRMPKTGGKGLEDVEKKLGYWMSNQRTNYSKGIGGMKDPEIKRRWEEALIEYPGLGSVDNVGNWIRKLEEVLIFVSEYDKVPSQHRPSPEGELGSWLINQRVRYHQRKEIMKNTDVRRRWEEFERELDEKGIKARIEK